MTIKKKLESQKGFTLIEVIISVIILSISLVTMIQGITDGLRLIGQAEKLATAARLAKMKLVELELKNFEIGAESSGSFEEEPNYRWGVEIRDPDLAEAKDFNISQVDLTIHWTEAETDRNILISTYTAKIQKLEE